jgi:hypothetical protein
MAWLGDSMGRRVEQGRTACATLSHDCTDGEERTSTIGEGSTYTGRPSDQQVLGWCATVVHDSRDR